MTRAFTPAEIRAKIAAITVAAANGCLVCTKSHNGDGYCQMRIESGRGSRQALVHRIAYALARGPIPAGLEIDHLCGNRACCRVEHLEAVTHAVNLARRARSCGSRVGRYRAPSEARRAAQRRYVAKLRSRRTLAGAAP